MAYERAWQQACRRGDKLAEDIAAIEDAREGLRELKEELRELKGAKWSWLGRKLRLLPPRRTTDD